MKLFLVRHSQTNYNVLGLCNGDPAVDVHLTREGIEQTQNLAELLREATFDTVYISELPRTRETAAIINQFHNKEVIVDGRLNDNRTGYEGKPVKEWQAALEASDDKWNAVFNDGESLAAAARRGQSFLEDVTHSGHDSILVVTHGFMTQALYGVIEHKTLEEASTFTLVQGTYAEFEL